MTLPKPPEMEQRRYSDFQDELLSRAHAWIPAWVPSDDGRDFGQALLNVAARFGAEVAERLDRVGDKVARGFLDWLAVRGDAARPARVPVTFKLAPTASDPVLAPRPVKMQADIDDATVTFETETDITVIPGDIGLIVGVDPANDQFYLPPPGLTSLGPQDPVPTQWQLKNFAAAGATRLQFDPGAGLADGLVVMIGGAQYTLSDVKGDLATITPAVQPADGFLQNTPVTRVFDFAPFNGARGQQNHVVYIGDTDLLNIQAKANILVTNAGSLAAGIKWEYWGKDDTAATDDTDARWRSFSKSVQTDDALILTKPKGSMETTAVNGTQSRWIRGSISHIDGASPLLTTDGLALKINPGTSASPTPAPASAEAFVNATASATSNFYPLGREPRLFDTLYLGCAEAFSKPGADARVSFQLAASVFASLSTLTVPSLGSIVAAIDTGGAFHLFRLETDGSLSRLPNRPPMTPADGVTITPDVPPVMWADGNDLHIAVSAADRAYIWTEVSPSSASGAASSKWLALDASGAGKIAGLALVKDNNPGGALLACGAQGVARWLVNLTQKPAPWDPVTIVPPAATSPVIVSLVHPRNATAPFFATQVLVVATDGGSSHVYTGMPGLNTQNRPKLTLTKIFAGIDPKIGPFAIEQGAKLMASAADGANLLAWSSADGLKQVSLGSAKIVEKTALGGRMDSDRFVVYAIAKDGQSLLTWLPPFPLGEADIPPFENPVGSGVGPLDRGIAILEAPGLAPRAIVPGRNRGELFAAVLGNLQLLGIAQATDFLSALQVSSPFPSISPGDTIAFDMGVTQATAKASPNPVNGRDGNVQYRFHPLDRFQDVDTGNKTVRIFKTSGQKNGTVTANSATELQFTPATVPNTPVWIYIHNITKSIFEVVKATGLGMAVASVTINGSNSTAGDSIDYWLPDSEVQANIFPALQLASPNNTSWTEDALAGSIMVFPALHPSRQLPIADFADAQKHVQWIAFQDLWNPAPVSAAIFGIETAITGWARLMGDTTSNPALAWEYWDGTSWSRLAFDNPGDGTNNLTNSGELSFRVPTNLKAVDWSGKTNYWIRARLIGGDYGHETVTVNTKTLSDGSTQQTVVRSTEGLQPPYALSVEVYYSIDQALPPAYLLTQDSGSLRNQSDANHTPGALIDIFTPLGYTLGHLKSSADGTAPAPCIPDCDCPSSSQSPALPSAPAPVPSPSADDCDCSQSTADAADAAASGSAGRSALYLGLTSAPKNASINILFAARDSAQGYDQLAPLTIETLTQQGFAPVANTDTTRALGEMGIVSVSFDSAPVRRELFGQSLCWIRLMPSKPGEWEPVLAGVYLNSVWAQAAETMTRELLGSSAGAPNLVLQLARPPLLKDSLELRVREPLGMEERKALTAGNSDIVKTDPDVDLPGDWVLWQQAVDPGDCAALDRVYALDEASGTIRFGDGQHGAIPPIGTDSIVAFQYKRTDLVVGSEVPANQIPSRTTLNLVTPVPTVQSVVSAGQSAGGLAPESPDRVVGFGAVKLRARGRAVSALDFEELALEDFADVVQARCFVRPGKIELVAVMRGKDPVPTRAQRRELRNLLLGAAPPAVGAAGALTISGPVVRRLSIALTLRVANLDVAGAVRKAASDRLMAYFDTQSGAANHLGWPLGSSPSADNVAEALLDTPDLESMEDIKLFEIDGNGNPLPWPASLRTNELAMLADDGIHILFTIQEAAA